MGDVRWLSSLKVQWYVGRHGSYFVIVEFKGTYRKGRPVIIRSLQAVGKGGRKEVIYSEIYSLEKAKEILSVENAIVEALAKSSGNVNVISDLKTKIYELENMVRLIKLMAESLEEVSRNT